MCVYMPNRWSVSVNCHGMRVERGSPVSTECSFENFPGLLLKIHTIYNDSDSVNICYL